MGPFKAKISSNHKLNFRRSTHDKLGGGGGGGGKGVNDEKPFITT